MANNVQTIFRIQFRGKNIAVWLNYHWRLFPNVIETEIHVSLFWGNIRHWLHRKLSFWQLPVQPVNGISSAWHFHFQSFDWQCLATNRWQCDTWTNYVTFILHNLWWLTPITHHGKKNSSEIWTKMEMTLLIYFYQENASYIASYEWSFWVPVKCIFGDQDPKRALLKAQQKKY